LVDERRELKILLLAFAGERPAVGTATSAD